jgi:hypothetical protein
MTKNLPSIIPPTTVRIENLWDRLAERTGVSRDVCKNFAFYELFSTQIEDDIEEHLYTTIMQRLAVKIERIKS